MKISSLLSLLLLRKRTSFSQVNTLLFVALAIFAIAGCQGSPRKRNNNVGERRQSGQQEVASECPDKYGFYADAEQCDRYYSCEDGIATPKLCPDGLVFLEAAGPRQEKCEFPFAVDCSDRPKLQPAQPTLNCPRKNGYFAHSDAKICDKFFYCVDGGANEINCPNGLVFSNRTGTCTWPDLAQKSNCGSGELYQFECPATRVNPDQPESVHPRYPDPKDCQFFYVCIDGRVPRRSGCSLGQVYNEKTQRCDKPKNVPECKDWYQGILDYDEDGEVISENNPPPPPSPAVQQAEIIPLRKNGQQRKKVGLSRRRPAGKNNNNYNGRGRFSSRQQPEDY